jgi:hypothetical protein
MHGLEDFRFVNLVVDAGTVHQMKTIPCLISNPYCPDPPVLLTLRENADFTTEQSSELFTELSTIVDSAGLLLSSVIVDDFPAQSSGLDRALFEAHSPLTHIHCFAYMANLILFHIVLTVNCARIMFALSEIQGLLRCKVAHEAIGAKCPRFICTRWFYMTDSLAFILEHVDEIAGYLHMVSETEQISCPLPTELFEFYAMLMPFWCLVSAVERHCRSLFVIISLIRDLLTALRDVAGILRTTSAHAILRDMYVRFLALASINNRTEASAAYCFTLQGRAEIRKSESGFSTQNPDFALESEFPGEIVNFKVYLKDRCFYDGVIVRLVEIIGNTTSLMTDAEGDFDASGDAVSGTEDGEEVASHDNYNERLTYFVALVEPDLMEHGPYHDLYTVATQYFRTFAAN